MVPAQRVSAKNWKRIKCRMERKIKGGSCICYPSSTIFFCALRCMQTKCKLPSEWQSCHGLPLSLALVADTAMYVTDSLQQLCDKDVANAWFSSCACYKIRYSHVPLTFLPSHKKTVKDMVQMKCIIVRAGQSEIDQQFLQRGRKIMKFNCYYNWPWGLGMR